jgi:predicted transcriptional regulator of viral defense system
LIRVKKGIYLRTDSPVPYSKELLANLMYGPSYVSLEYALQFHGLIPEAVKTVTSVTTGRRKSFTTPVGRFEYEHLAPRYFSLGIDIVNLEEGGRAFFIASPEKALFDTI